MKRHTIKTRNLSSGAWHVYKLPRGRILQIAVTGVATAANQAASLVSVTFREDYPRYLMYATYNTRDSQVIHVDVECNGLVRVHVSDDKYDCELTFWYADETTEFQIQV